MPRRSSEPDDWEKARAAQRMSDLAQLQSLPLDAKVWYATTRIRRWLDHTQGQAYVAFSGGKDSTALLHLVRKVRADVPAVFHDTGLEFPEIRDFVRKFDNVTWTRPKMGFREVLDRYGIPLVSKRVAQYVHEARHAGERGGENILRLRMTGVKGDGTYSQLGKIPDKWQFLVEAPYSVSDKCCKVMKKDPAKAYESATGRVGFIGTRAEEGQQRSLTWCQQGCNAYTATKQVSAPLSIWTDQDVDDYVAAEGLELAEPYAMGYRRTGCVFCGFGCHLEPPGLGRFELLKKTHPKLHDYCMRPRESGGLGLRQPLEDVGHHIGRNLTGD